MQTLNYRPDIDGLRAVAVLAVIFYHANPAWLPGGFVGVDVFFVISGFLITQIIHTELQAGRFSFRLFYLRRIKRILPPFMAVITITLLAGFFLLSSREYLDLAKSARYALTFLANHYFSAEQDYFAPSAEEMPLLHMWSLSVEEQYYFIWPALLLFLRARLPRLIIVMPAFFMVASFALATLWASAPSTQSLAYYLLPARLGELMIGSLLALYAKPCNNPVLAGFFSLTGIVFILGSCVLLSRTSLFPGYNALWPCIGTAFLIHAGSCKTIPLVSRLLSLRPVVFIGLLSYSLYLWHWPILAHTRYYLNESSLPHAVILACMMGTLIASYCSWRFIETPIRKGTFSFQRAALLIFVAPSVALLLICGLIKITDGHLWRDSSLGLDTIESPSLVCHNRIGDNCRAGTTNTETRTLIVGDSHGAHLTTFFDLLGKKQGWSADIISVDSCPPLTGTDLARLEHSKQRQRCSALIDYIRLNSGRYENIVYSLRWELHMGYRKLANYNADPQFMSLLESDIAALVRQGKRVYLVSQVPLFRFNVDRLYRTSGKPNPVNADYLDANSKLIAIASQSESDNIFYIDTASTISRWPNGIIEGFPAYKDENHLNVYGQKKLAEENQAFEWLGNSFAGRQ